MHRVAVALTVLLIAGGPLKIIGHTSAPRREVVGHRDDTSFRMVAMTLSGFYINLDRSKRRRTLVEGQLRSAGLLQFYQRIDAVDGKRLGLHPAKACAQSHLLALDKSVPNDLVHIIEDDVLIGKHAAAFLRSREAEAAADAYDLVFLDMWVDPDQRAFFAASRGSPDAPSIINMRGRRIGAMASYLFRGDRAQKIKAAIEPHLERGALDYAATIAIASGSLTAGVAVPFLTGIDPVEGVDSLIQARLSRRHYSEALRLRAAFFAHD